MHNVVLNGKRSFLICMNKHPASIYRICRQTHAVRRGRANDARLYCTIKEKQVIERWQ